jgi:PKD repeat protein
MKEGSKILGLLSAITIVLTLTLSLTSIRANTPTLTIKPQKIVNTSITIGSIITINASVIDIVDLYTWQIKVFFNPKVLNCTKAWLPLDHVFAGKTIVPVSPQIDNEKGYVLYGASLMGGVSGYNGSGTLCQIEFKVVGTGLSQINFSRPYGEDTFLLNSGLDYISVTIVDGCFDNRPAVPKPPVALFDYSPRTPTVNQTITFNASKSYDPDGTIVEYKWDFGDGKVGAGKTVTHSYLATGTYQVKLTVKDNDGLTNATMKEITVYGVVPANLSISPQKIIDPTLLPPALIKVNVTVGNVTNMYSYRFKLSYNTQMLTCIGAIVNIVQNQTNYTPIILINDREGYIDVNVTYNPPAKPITTTDPLALVTLYLRIDTVGSSTLHLYETKLLDPTGQPITHVTEDGLIMTLIRDVAITYVAPSTNWAYQGWTVDITVKAKNRGNISESFDVKTYYNGSLIGTLPVVNLPPSTETTLVFTWNTSGVQEGNYTIRAEATVVPYEYNTTNNILEDGTIQILTKIRDIAITNVVTSRNWAFPGLPVNITITAENIGETTESFDIKVYYDNNLLLTHHITNMNPASKITLTFTWNTTGLTPCSSYTIKAEATPVPYEYNTTNNILVDGTVKIRILGDINGDNKVDFKDIGIAAKAFGSYPGHERWNPDADITGPKYLTPDGTVDMRDIALISRNFGKSC